MEDLFSSQCAREVFVILITSFIFIIKEWFDIGLLKVFTDAHFAIFLVYIFFFLTFIILMVIIIPMIINELKKK